MAEELKSNENSLENETVKESNPPEKVMAKPKIFIPFNEKIECIVNGFYNKETGAFEFAVPGEIEENNERFIILKHVFNFSTVPYNRLNNYRSQSLAYNQADRSSSVNVLKLREYFWIFHLEDWNFEDENGNKIELKHDPSGALADESLDLLYSLPATILDVAMGIYERKINIA